MTKGVGVREGMALPEWACGRVGVGVDELEPMRRSRGVALAVEGAGEELTDDAARRSFSRYLGVNASVDLRCVPFPVLLPAHITLVEYIAAKEWTHCGSWTGDWLPDVWDTPARSGRAFAIRPRTVTWRSLRFSAADGVYQISCEPGICSKYKTKKKAYLAMGATAIWSGGRLVLVLIQTLVFFRHAGLVVVIDISRRAVGVFGALVDLSSTLR